jgi:transposase
MCNHPVFLPELPGMLAMELIAEIRRRHLVQRESISSIARSLNICRQTVRKHLKTEAEPAYKRENQPVPKLGDYKPVLETWLTVDASLAKPRRRTAQRLFEGLQAEGYQGSYDSVQRFVKAWKAQQKATPKLTQAFVPLSFPIGEVGQFDWSHEQVELGGVIQTVKLAHFRLAYSRKMFVVAYPREAQEMVLDAHSRAFAFFGGVPTKMLYDNLKTVVEAVLTGKERRFNRRFLALANHYLFEPVACTPESGWEKGQIENQVGNIREWLFTPCPRFNNFTALNAWLAQRCEELAGRKHPAFPDKTIAMCFQEEQPTLRPVMAAFDGYIESMVRVSSTCLIRIDRNRYSVPAEWAGKIISARISADRIQIVADQAIQAEHPRCFLRDQLVCDPWHYLSVLEKKPGALRHGAPFQSWDLPLPIRRVRDRLLKQPKGDRAFVELLLLARDKGLEALEVACEITLETGVISAAIIENELRRLTEPERPKALSTHIVPTLTLEPLADCTRYDSLRGGYHVH